MIARKFAWLATALLLSGCAAEDAPPETGSTPPFRPVANVQELMLTIVEPAAETYWDAVGWIVDADGTQEIRPESEEDWEEVRNAAFLVAESGNLLMMQGRAVDDGPWISMSQALIDVGDLAIQAALARDEAAVFDVGAQVYAACTACHSAYALETLRPNFDPDE